MHSVNDRLEIKKGRRWNKRKKHCLCWVISSFDSLSDLKSCSIQTMFLPMLHFLPSSTLIHYWYHALKHRYDTKAIPFHWKTKILAQLEILNLHLTMNIIHDIHNMLSHFKICFCDFYVDIVSVWWCMIVFLRENYHR